MPSSRLDVLAAISRERSYQDRKRGPLSSRPLGVGCWLTVLRVELAEAEEAWSRRHPDDADALREVLQVAAVCVACLEQHGVYEREGEP